MLFSCSFNWSFKHLPFDLRQPTHKFAECDKQYVQCMQCMVHNVLYGPHSYSHLPWRSPWQRQQFMENTQSYLELNCALNSGTVSKSCSHAVQSAFNTQISQFESPGYPRHLTVSLTEGIFRKWDLGFLNLDIITILRRAKKKRTAIVFCTFMSCCMVWNKLQTEWMQRMLVPLYFPSLFPFTL